MRKIRVGMDISQTAHLGGVGTYTKNLSAELSKVSNLEMIYFYSSLRRPYRGDFPNVKSFKMPPSFFEFLFNRMRFPIEKFLGPLDVFHSSDWVQPKTKAKKVTTYHDLVPLIYPEWSHPKIINVHKRRLKLVEKEVDMVIAVSESTKKDLMKISDISEEKIVVVYEGPTLQKMQYADDKIKKFKEKYNLPQSFILAMGGVGERKNLNRIKEAGVDYNLVIAGETIPVLPADELGLLYSSADALVYTSLYEGFGLPILDAFSCGLPVLTSNVSSMPEVGGNAALYANPYDVADIKNKIRLIVEDEGLRNEMIKKGFARVKEFSWEKTAGETAEIYERLTS